MTWLRTMTALTVLALGAAVAGGAHAATALTAKLTAPTRAVVGQEVTLDASASTGDNLRYSWDFGDGAFLLGSSVMTHTYAEPGDYTVRVDVTDGDNADAVATFTITVSDAVIGDDTGSLGMPSASEPEPVANLPMPALMPFEMSD